ncbi:MAG: serine hydrolase [Pseudomonadota bacterium]
MKLITILLIALSFAAAPVQANEQVRLGLIEAAFERWLKTNRANGVLSVRRKGVEKAVFSKGIPGNAQVEIASLSKAITGVCAAQLIRSGKLRADQTVADALGSGPDVTLAQLLTHTSGLRPDSTQGAMAKWLGSTRDRSLDVLAAIEKRRAPKPGKYLYNNENYALAGLMIANAMNASYAQTCQTQALSPASVRGAAGAQSGGFQPWGGWAMTVSDYSKFHSYWFGGNRATARKPTSYPHVNLGGGAGYGLGTFFRTGRNGSNFWHFGAYCMRSKFQMGTYAVTWGGDYTITAYYDRCVKDSAMGALDAAMIDAVFGAL